MLAFVVGFREETFRQLIKRAVDILLGPGIPGVTPPAAVSVTPSPIDFGEVVADSPKQLPVKVANTGSGNLFIDPSTAGSRRIYAPDFRTVLDLRTDPPPRSGVSRAG